MKTSLNFTQYNSLGSFDAKAALRFFLSAFFATCAVALSVQLVIIPHLLPHLNAGHGMLVGGDSAGMNDTAAAMAARIRAEGWSVWELRVAGNAPTGIAAVFYYFFTPEPYVLIPVNALVHAAGGLVIYVIVFQIARSQLAALVGSLPFLMFPSAASWYAQIHKDGFFALGMLLCALGWMQGFRRDFWDMPSVFTNPFAFFGRLAALVGPVALGLWLVWVVRPHIMILMQAVGLITTLAGLVMLTIWWRSGAMTGPKATKAAFLLVAILVLMVVLKPSDYRVESWRGDVVVRENVMQYMPSQCVLARGESAQADKLASTVAAMRDFFVSGKSYANAKSNMDADFVPGTLCNLLSYLPRALQIGFLAPFPSAWMGDGSVAANTVMRRVVSFEMMVTYLAVLLLPLALWDFRRTPAFWFVLGFCTLLIVIHTYLVPNLGTLHRMRYGFLACVVGLSVGAVVRRLLLSKSTRGG